MKLSELENKKLLFRGKEFSLKIINTSVLNNRITINNDFLCITVVINPKINESQLCEEIVSRIYAWYKAQARRFFLEEAVIEKSKHGVAFKEIAIKDTVTRWGSCSAKKNMNFNWRLVMAPPHILRYVVCHEMAHLTHLNHSTDFWNLVEKMYPDYKAAKQWLADNGEILLNFKL